MGASLSVVFRSPQKADEIADFLIEHSLEPLKALGWKWDTGWWVVKSRLGTKYSTFHGANRELVFAMLRWVALNWGRKQRGFQIHEVEKPFAEPVPYVSYDECDNWPVLGPAYQRRVPKRLHWCQVNSVGIPVHPEHSYDLLGILPNAMEIMVQADPKSRDYEANRLCLAKPFLVEAIKPLQAAMVELTGKLTP